MELERQVEELKKENSGLKSVVIACSKEPMPDWSARIWDLHENVKEVTDKLSKATKLIERFLEFRTINDLDLIHEAEAFLKGKP